MGNINNMGSLRGGYATSFANNFPVATPGIAENTLNTN